MAILKKLKFRKKKELQEDTRDPWEILNDQSQKVKAATEEIYKATDNLICKTEGQLK